MMAKAAGNSDSLPPTAVAPLLDSTQVAERMMRKVSSLSVYANLSKSPGNRLALGAPSLVFSPSARTCSLKRSHHYALGHEHALKAKILRDHRAPW